MANQRVTQFDGWTKVRREYRVARFSPSITIRRNGSIAISADFVRRADIGDCTRASIFLSGDGMNLALRFHSDQADDDGFLLGRDGGNGGGVKVSRLITARALLRQSPMLAAMARDGTAALRFEPTRNIDGLWVVELTPTFEQTLDERSSIGRDVTGIYRYRLGMDTVYIGRGRITERLSTPDRRAWQFDVIEYSILNDDDAEKRWEAHWINAYRTKHNRLPVYNKIAGCVSLAG